MISSGVSIIFFQFIHTTNCRIIVDEFRCNACVLLSFPIIAGTIAGLLPDGTNKIHTC